MMLALKSGAASNDADPGLDALARDRYSTLGKLRGTGRAEVLVGLPKAARLASGLVVIKTFPADLARSSASIASELELATLLQHDNLVTVLGVGAAGGRPFIVSEYLEGTTLERLLRWLDSRGQKLPHAAVARILLAIFVAVEHADRRVAGGELRALVHQPIAADDVFVTYDGDVRLLGFKPVRPRHSENGDVMAVNAAVDDLIARQRSPELGALLARVGQLASPSRVGLSPIARALHDWQTENLRSDGRAELAATMAGVFPERRAARRAQLEAACARVLRARAAVDLEIVRGADEPLSDGSSSMSPVAASFELPMRYERGSLLPMPLSELALLSAPVAPEAETHPWVLAPQALAPEALAPEAFAPEALAPEAFAPQPSAEPTPTNARWLPFVAVLLAGLATLIGYRLHITRTEQRPNVVPTAIVTAANSATVPGPRPLAAAIRSASSRSGYLTLDTTPPSSVSMGNVALGRTPLVAVEIAEGRYELALENEGLGITSRVVVDIVSGETTVRRIALEAPVQAARQ